jgi:O-antigen/teichoic acid export membrane protein
MLKYLKQLTGDSLIYGISSVISGFISLFLVPVYTKIFQPADYGILNLVNVTFFLLNIFVVFGLDSAVAVWFWDKTEESERKKTFASWFWFQTGISLVMCLLICVFSTVLSRAILSTPDYYYLFIIGALNLPFLSTHRILMNWYKYQRKAVPTVIFTLTISLTIILLSILFVVILRIGVKGVFIAQLIASVVGACFVLVKLYKWFAFRFFNKERLREMLHFAAPLVPAALSYWALSNAGSYVIEKFSSSKSEVGLYQIGITFAGFVNIVVLAFNQAWPPFALSISKKEGHQYIYASVFLFYITLGSIIASALWMFSPEILSLLTAPAYYGASTVVGILGFNVFIMGIASITSIGLNLAKTNKPYAHGVFLASILSVALYFVLVPFMGKEGAAWSTLAGSISLVTFVSVKAHRLYPVPYNWSKAFMYILLSGILVVLTRYFIPVPSGYLFLYKVILFFIFLAAMAALNITNVKKIILSLRRNNEVAAVN